MKTPCRSPFATCRVPMPSRKISAKKRPSSIRSSTVSRVAGSSSKRRIAITIKAKPMSCGSIWRFRAVNW